jgi:hypothetical protein
MIYLAVRTDGYVLPYRSKINYKICLVAVRGMVFIQHVPDNILDWKYGSDWTGIHSIEYIPLKKNEYRLYLKKLKKY